MKYKAICFDIDGTLYPASQMRKRLIAVWFKNPLFVKRYMKMRTKFRSLQSGFDDKLSLREREARILECTVDELNKKFYEPLRMQYEELEGFDGVRETFEWIKSKGLKIGVFSDFPLFRKLEKLGVSDLVDVAFSSDDVGFLKPSVHPFENLLYKLDVRPSEALYIGDEPQKDFVGATGAGMDAYLIQDWKSFDRYLKEI